MSSQEFPMGAWFPAWSMAPEMNSLPEKIEFFEGMDAHDWRNYMLPGDSEAWPTMPEAVRKIVYRHAHYRSMDRIVSVSFHDTEDEYTERYFAGDRSAQCARTFALVWRMAMDGTGPSAA